MSDDDLDIMEALCIAYRLGYPWTVQAMVTTMKTDPDFRCFMKLTPRQKRETEIAWLNCLTSCTTDDQVRTLIREVRAKSTPDERKAMLLFLHIMSWPAAICGGLT